MKKVLTLVLALMSIPIISNAEDNITLNVVRDSKTQWTLSVALNNDNKYGGFQMDLVIPSQFTAAIENIAKTTRLRSITMQANHLASGNLRIVGYGATKTKNITGNNGDIITMKLTCTTPLPIGEHKITAKNIRFSNATSETVLAGTYTSFNVEEMPQHTVNYWNGEELFHTMSVEEGDSIPAIESPEAKEGFAFCGWDDSTAVMPDHDLDLHATWCRLSYTASYTVNGDTVYSEQVAYGDSVKLYNYTPEETHIFVKWIGDSYETMPAHNISYEAQLALVGDVNLDGTVNTSDVVSIYNYIISSEESGILLVCADINGDGTVNSADVTGLYNLLTYGTPLGSKAYRQALVNAFK